MLSGTGSRWEEQEAGGRNRPFFLLNQLAKLKLGLQSCSPSIPKQSAEGRFGEKR